MTSRAAARLAWGIALLCLSVVAASLVLLYLNRAVIGSVGPGASDLVPSVTLGVLGALVASRRPANRIGWLMLAIAALVGTSGLAGLIAIRALLAGVSPHGWIRWSAWVGNWLGNPALAALVLVFLLFPDGKLLSRRWRWAVGLTVVVSVWFVGGVALDPTPVQLSPHLPSLGNPVGVGALAGFGNSPAFLGIVLLLALAVIALLLRLRRSRGEERQQLKWFVYASGLSVGVLILAIPATSVSPELSNVMFAGAFSLGFAFLVPGAAALAILRFGLYEIDVVINKTIVYGALTLLLGGIYAGLAVGLGSIARSSNSVVIAGSTLVVAALFRPVRRRVQAFIDRRFYRRKYNAARTLEAFSARLRHEVDLDELSGQLVGVVRETMQPSHASIWLRPSGKAEM